MQEFASVSASSYDPAALVARLNEKSADGWSVVAIVGTGGDVTAFLSREASGASAPAAATPQVATTTVEPAATAVATPSVDEPAGWAASPTVSIAQVAEQAPVAQASAQPAAATAQVAASTVPAQWAADPTGRYELRYWDGTRWTEHVSRAGQQYTDPL
jgi:hypothetical protein